MTVETPEPSVVSPVVIQTKLFEISAGSPLAAVLQSIAEHGVVVVPATAGVLGAAGERRPK